MIAGIKAVLKHLLGLSSPPPPSFQILEGITLIDDSDSSADQITHPLTEGITLEEPKPNQHKPCH